MIVRADPWRDGGEVTLRSLFERMLDGYLDDPGLLSLLASSAYTYLNLIYVEIEDSHEAVFLGLHAAHIGTREPD